MQINFQNRRAIVLGAVTAGGLLAAALSAGAHAASLAGTSSNGTSSLSAASHLRYVTAPPGYGEVHVIILGVTAPFFVFGIEQRFKEIPGVEKVTFILEEGLADVWIKPGAHVTDDDLRKAVRSASFSLGKIIWIRRPEETAVTHAATGTSAAPVLHN